MTAVIKPLIGRCAARNSERHGQSKRQGHDGNRQPGQRIVAPEFMRVAPRARP